MTQRLFALICTLGAITITILMLLMPRSAAATPAAPNIALTVTRGDDPVPNGCAIGDCSLREAVNAANSSGSPAGITISTSVTSILLTSPITVTGGNIGIWGNGSEVTQLHTHGNFPALVLSSDNNLVLGFWIEADVSRSGANQHGIVVHGYNNTIRYNSLSNLGGDGIFVAGGYVTAIEDNLIGVQSIGGTQLALCTFQNNQWGIQIVDGHDNLIQNNTIGCSGIDGIILTGSNSFNNRFKNNYVGVTNTGARVPNTLAGIAIAGSADNNIIGGMPAERNIIGGNGTVGVYIGDLATEGNVVMQNQIGISGTLNISNTTDGVVISNGPSYSKILTNSIAYNAHSGIYLFNAGQNTIEGNSIHHQVLSGIWQDGGFGNLIQDNLIGIETSGNTLLAGCNFANTDWGIRLNDSFGDDVFFNTIGCSGQDGIAIVGANSHDNQLVGNFIGVNKAGGRTPNAKAGVTLWGGAHDNQIGISIEGNTIGANGTFGVYIGDTNTTTNTVQWNSIGISGTLNISNTLDGVVVIGGAHANRVYTNTIANNGHNGVWLSDAGTSNNILQANTIQSNHMAGVAIQSGAHDNQIGSAGYGNLIGANGTYGVYVSDSGTTTNTIQQNSIGLNGILNISNTLDGVAIVGGAHVNRVYTNTIVYNGHNGVWLSGAGTINNVLQANVIRLNQLAGVAIENSASANSIGPGARSMGNVISANAFDGVYINGNSTIYNSVSGNTIGATANGNVADPNGGNGVVFDNGTSGNVVGWSAAERNVIAGNTANGVLIENGAHDNWVYFNDIGTNRAFPVAAFNAAPNKPGGGGTDYLALPNGGGVSIYNAYTNTIGGIGVDNFIEHNVHTSVYLSGGSFGNVIGSNIVQGSGDYGVLLDGGNTAYNTITRTQIYSNGLDGIGERNGAGFNVWTEVGIHDNGGLGIDKIASNDGQNIVNAPKLVISATNKQSGVVQGYTDVSGLAAVKIELYRVAPDPSGFGEGSIFVGQTTADSNGHWTIIDPTPAQSGGCYTALETRAYPFLLIPYSSSEFSANTCRVFLPTLQR